MSDLSIVGFACSLRVWVCACVWVTCTGDTSSSSAVISPSFHRATFGWHHRRVLCLTPPLSRWNQQRSVERCWSGEEHNHNLSNLITGKWRFSFKSRYSCLVKCQPNSLCFIILNILFKRTKNVKKNTIFDIRLLLGVYCFPLAAKDYITHFKIRAALLLWMHNILTETLLKPAAIGWFSTVWTLTRSCCSKQVNKQESVTVTWFYMDSCVCCDRPGYQRNSQ